MKAWRFYGFNDMRLDEVRLTQFGYVRASCDRRDSLCICVQPSVTEAQLAYGIPTLAYERVRLSIDWQPRHRSRLFRKAWRFYGFNDMRLDEALTQFVVRGFNM